MTRSHQFHRKLPSLANTSLRSSETFGPVDEVIFRHSIQGKLNDAYRSQGLSAARTLSLLQHEVERYPGVQTDTVRCRPLAWDEVPRDEGAMPDPHSSEPGWRVVCTIKRGGVLYNISATFLNPEQNRISHHFEDPFKKYPGADLQTDGKSWPDQSTIQNFFMHAIVCCGIGGRLRRIALEEFDKVKPSFWLRADATKRKDTSPMRAGMLASVQEAQQSYMIDSYRNWANLIKPQPINGLTLGHHEIVIERASDTVKLILFTTAHVLNSGRPDYALRCVEKYAENMADGIEVVKRSYPRWNVTHAEAKLNELREYQAYLGDNYSREFDYRNPYLAPQIRTTFIDVLCNMLHVAARASGMRIKSEPLADKYISKYVRDAGIHNFTPLSAIADDIFSEAEVLEIARNLEKPRPKLQLDPPLDPVSYNLLVDLKGSARLLEETIKKAEPTAKPKQRGEILAALFPVVCDLAAVKDDHPEWAKPLFDSLDRFLTVDHRDTTFDPFILRELRCVVGEVLYGLEKIRRVKREIPVQSAPEPEEIGETATLPPPVPPKSVVHEESVVSNLETQSTDMQPLTVRQEIQDVIVQFMSKFIPPSEREARSLAAITEIVSLSAKLPCAPEEVEQTVKDIFTQATTGAFEGRYGEAEYFIGLGGKSRSVRRGQQLLLILSSKLSDNQKTNLEYLEQAYIFREGSDAALERDRKIQEEKEREAKLAKQHADDLAQKAKDEDAALEEELRKLEALAVEREQTRLRTAVETTTVLLVSGGLNEASARRLLEKHMGLAVRLETRETVEVQRAITWIGEVFGAENVDKIIENEPNLVAVIAEGLMTRKMLWSFADRRDELLTGRFRVKTNDLSEGHAPWVSKASVIAPDPQTSAAQERVSESVKNALQHAQKKKGGAVVMVKFVHLSDTSELEKNASLLKGLFGFSDEQIGELFTKVPSLMQPSPNETDSFGHFIETKLLPALEMLHIYDAADIRSFLLDFPRVINSELTTKAAELRSFYCTDRAISLAELKAAVMKNKAMILYGKEVLGARLGRLDTILTNNKIICTEEEVLVHFPALLSFVNLTKPSVSGEVPRDEQLIALLVRAYKARNVSYSEDVKDHQLALEENEDRETKHDEDKEKFLGISMKDVQRAKSINPLAFEASIMRDPLALTDIGELIRYADHLGDAVAKQHGAKMIYHVVQRALAYGWTHDDLLEYFRDYSIGSANVDLYPVSRPPREEYSPQQVDA